jgi:hypothetical protein
MQLATTISSSSTADVLEIVNDVAFTTATDYAVTLSDTASSAELAAIDADTSGIITVNTTSVGANLNYYLSTDLAAPVATNLADFTGLTAIDASEAGDAGMTITAADIFAANDSTGDLTLTVTGSVMGNDVLDLSTGIEVWSTADGGATYTATGNFDSNMADTETYTINVTHVNVI